MERGKKEIRKYRKEERKKGKEKKMIK